MARYEVAPGTDLPIIHQIRDSGLPFDITGSSVYWRLFASASDANADAVLERSWIAGVEDGLSLTDPETMASVTEADGILYNFLDSVTLATLTANRIYYYRLTITDATPNTITTQLESGTLAITTMIIASQVTTTVTTVRREIQDKLDDLLVMTATADGSTTTFTDTINLFESDDGLVGCHIVGVSGTAANVGKIARIDGNTNSIATIGFSPEFPESTATGDEIDLYNMNGAGWTYQAIIRRMNAVLNESFPRLKVLLQISGTANFDDSDPFITIPYEMTHLSSIEFEDTNGNWTEVPPAFRKDHPESLSVEVTGSFRWMMNDCSYRLNGYGKHPPVTTESDQIYLDPRWLTLEVASRLGSQPSRHQTMRQWAMEWKKQADTVYQDITPPSMNNTFRYR